MGTLKQEKFVMSKPAKTLIAFGSNENSAWGDARETLRASLLRVSAAVSAPIRCSNFYHTPAFPAGLGPDFVNAVAAIETTLDPAALLALLHDIEAQAGRVRSTRWGQRTLDLDLIAYDAQVLPDHTTFQKWHDLAPDQQAKVAPGRLILPHPRLQDRAFVLVPLCDVAADWRHPVLGRTAQQLCDALPTQARAEVVKIGPVKF
jgi:2-amino-4-hydroxy-6-hydroxymethyldihydropteridine diphosphokinase